MQFGFRDSPAYQEFALARARLVSRAQAILSSTTEVVCTADQILDLLPGHSQHERPTGMSSGWPKLQSF